MNLYSIKLTIDKLVEAWSSINEETRIKVFQERFNRDKVNRLVLMKDENIRASLINLFCAGFADQSGGVEASAFALAWETNLIDELTNSEFLMLGKAFWDKGDTIGSKRNYDAIFDIFRVAGKEYSDDTLTELAALAVKKDPGMAMDFLEAVEGAVNVNLLFEVCINQDWSDKYFDEDNCGRVLQNWLPYFDDNQLVQLAGKIDHANKFYASKLRDFVALPAEQRIDIQLQISLSDDYYISDILEKIPEPPKPTEVTKRHKRRPGELNADA